MIVFNGGNYDEPSIVEWKFQAIKEEHLYR